MVVEKPYSVVHPAASAVAGSGPGRARRIGSAVAFLASLGFVIAYALPAGAYGVVVRQEYAMVVWWLIAVGFAVRVLPRARLTRPAVAVLGLLLIYGGWTATSLAWTRSEARTSAEVARVLGYVGIFVLGAVALDRRTWRAALAGLGAGAGLVCALALASRLAPSQFPANPLFSPGTTNRLSYPFGYWNAVGAWGAMTAAFALAWSAHDVRRVARALSLGVLPICVAVIYLSYSRAAILGMVVGLLVVLALSRSRHTVALHAVGAVLLGGAVILLIRAAPQIADGTGTAGATGVALCVVLAALLLGGLGVATGATGLDRRHMPLRLRSTLVVLVAAIIAFSAAAFAPRLVSRAWHEFHRPAVVTSSDPASRLTQLSGTRYGLWRSALDAFSAHPFSGTGAGTFEYWWNQHGTNAEFVRNAHSVELENLAELGLPGAVLILGLLLAGVLVLAQARRRARRRVSAGATVAALAAFAVYIVQASVDWLWQSTAVTALAVALLAVAVRRPEAEPPRMRAVVRSIAVLGAVAAAVVQLPGMLTTASIGSSQAAERAGRPATALGWATTAISAEDWNADAYEQRALVLEAGGRLAAARADIHHAVSLEPFDFRHWLVLARVEAELGDLAAATRADARARQLRPYGT